MWAGFWDAFHLDGHVEYSSCLQILVYTLYSENMFFGTIQCQNSNQWIGKNLTISMAIAQSFTLLCK